MAHRVVNLKKEEKMVMTLSDKQLENHLQSVVNFYNDPHKILLCIEPDDLMLMVNELMERRLMWRTMRDRCKEDPNCLPNYAYLWGF